MVFVPRMAIGEERCSCCWSVVRSKTASNLSCISWQIHNYLKLSRCIYRTLPPDFLILLSTIWHECVIQYSYKIKMAYNIFYCVVIASVSEEWFTLIPPCSVEFSYSLMSSFVSTYQWWFFVFPHFPSLVSNRHSKLKHLSYQILIVKLLCKNWPCDNG